MRNLQVIKRDGRFGEFKEEKIFNAIKKACKDMLNSNVSDSEISELTKEVVSDIMNKDCDSINVEEIQDLVVDVLKRNGYTQLYKEYDRYREERNKIRDKKHDLMKAIVKIGKETDRDNANVGNNFSAKLLRIASEANKWQNLASMPKELAKEHENGDSHTHDLDAYNLTVNCLQINTGKHLKNGFNTGYGFIRPAKRIETAVLLSCILLQSSQNDMFGGQSHVNLDNDLAPYLKMTIDEIRDELISYGLRGEKLEAKLKSRLKKVLRRCMKSLIYNLNTMHSRAGSQIPFSSINIGLPDSEEAAMICNELMKAYNRGLGKGEQPIFPNIIFRVKDGVNKKPRDPYYYLFKTACKVASKRMNPTFMNIDADFNKMYYDKGIYPATMGCRTYIMSNINGEDGPSERGNIAPQTINIVRLGIRANKDVNKFFELFLEKLLLARKSLLHRYSVLKELRVKDLPFVAGQGLIKGSEGLNPDDSIEPILKQGTFAIGYIGLAETLTALIGSHHGQTEEARELGLKIVQFMRDFCDKYKEIDKLNWGCYATPAEGLSGRFVRMDRYMYGVIEGVTDKDYYTNSFHVPVSYNISIMDKLRIEAPYHKLCNAGHVSYIELDGYPTPDTVEKIVTTAYNTTNINYIGINFHIRYCKNCCTYLNEEHVCTNCGSDEIQGISRITGYLTLDERFGDGKLAEKTDRVSHDGNAKKIYANI